MFRERQTTVSRRLLTNLANSFRQPGAFLVASNESRTSSRLPITSAMAAPPVKSSSKGKAAKPDLRKRKTGKKGGEDPTPELPKETAEVRRVMSWRAMACQAESKYRHPLPTQP